MALEMFAGKTGDRLIARLPVADGSYADVGVALQDTELMVRLEYHGKVFNKYPVLHPTEESLAQYHNLLTILNSGRVRLSSTIGFIPIYTAELDEAAARGDVTAMIKRYYFDADRVGKSLKQRLTAKPFCPRIMVGEILQLRAPKVFGEITNVNLGIVTSITIHNAT